MAAWRRRGQRVQPFKVGPDYIDPGHHSAAAGRASRNLDSVLLPTPRLQSLFATAAKRADISVVEGVMGLFDGRNDHGEQGSTAHVAKLLHAPVVVVLDVSHIGRSVGAVGLGLLHFDPSLPIAGFILNRVASEAHERIAREAVEAATGLPVFGSIPRDVEIAVPERHLGLVPTTEGALDDYAVARLADVAERNLALDLLWMVADEAARDLMQVDDLGLDPSPVRVALGIARDRAFSFYYEDSLEVLAAYGSDLVPFSPLNDETLPVGIQGLYLGGGFPEVFARDLAENQPMHHALRAAAAAGMPIYGECGGLMYLGRTLTDFDGGQYEMAGVLPLDSVMRPKRVSLGYRTVTSLRPNLLLPARGKVVGHEFHYSELTTPPTPGSAAYRIEEREGALEGFAAGNLLASYVHVHFGSEPAMAQRFVDVCARTAPYGR
jgi:cobyrinic acid a,c-diamide synthase